MALFDEFRDDPEYQAILADLRVHWKTRPCPEGCGCTETYDDRDPGRPDGGFGLAGCSCTRCQLDEVELGEVH